MDGWCRNKKGTFLLFFLVGAIFWGMSQTPARKSVNANKIIILHADSMELSQERKDIYILRGNVQFRHDSAYMYCDSAYFSELANTMDAYSNVRINQGDTLSLVGDSMNYIGNLYLAKMYDNIIMYSRNDNLTLYTDNLDYDRKANIAYYYYGGTVTDPQNELTSNYGSYAPNTKMATFKGDVQLVNQDMETQDTIFVLTTDTLNYNTQTRIAYIISPSVIESDSGKVYSSRGWYNTAENRSMLYDRSIVESKDKTKTMTADSIFYDRAGGIVEGFVDMILTDTARRAMLTGNYGFYDENRKYAFATDSALVIEYSQPDSLFCHADSVFMEQDALGRQEVRAYYGVRFYRTDIQGVCDSMRFNNADSVLYMYKNPVLWNTAYQIHGDTMQIFFNDSTIERMDVLNYSFVIEEKDSSYFNQIKGRELNAFFLAGELYHVDVTGNAEMIYYPVDEKDASFLGRYRTITTYMGIDVKNRKPARIVWWPNPDLKAIPMPDLTSDDKFLKGFVNYDYLRPKDKMDVFSKIKMKETDVVVQPRRQGRSRGGR
ncbi:MAG: LPS export ABC transporter periplasmic protein LptC [Dysgonamonadaceae bacterium]|jgi:lipopolysaccharide export system protein LptA|nr:LPS export ABC transporter periplasmic protein LptC [Dysgonamonadaceae bacterium]